MYQSSLLGALYLFGLRCFSVFIFHHVVGLLFLLQLLLQSGESQA